MESLAFWHWLVAALVLVIIEMLAPATFFLWMGISAGVVGLLLWVFPGMAWEWQFIVFAIMSVGSIVWWRFWAKKHATKSEDETLNHRTQQYVGRTFTLTEPIRDGVGKIHADDAQWRVSGADCEAGTRVKVISADTMMLYVEPV